MPTDLTFFDITRPHLECANGVDGQEVTFSVPTFFIHLIAWFFGASMALIPFWRDFFISLIKDTAVPSIFSCMYSNTLVTLCCLSIVQLAAGKYPLSKISRACIPIYMGDLLSLVILLGLAIIYNNILYFEVSNISPSSKVDSLCLVLFICIFIFSAVEWVLSSLSKIKQDERGYSK